MEKNRKSFSFPLTCDADLGILPAMAHGSTLLRPHRTYPTLKNSLPGPRSVCQHLPGAGGVLTLLQKSEHMPMYSDNLCATRSLLAEGFPRTCAGDLRADLKGERPWR